MGLSARSQKIIQSLRMATDQLDIALTLPRNDLLGDRDENEAYLLAEPGRQYALYFPDGGSVVLDMSHASGQWNYNWINLDEAEWVHSGQVQAGRNVRLTTPGEGHWIAVILSLQIDENFETDPIQPFSGNPFYWQYKGEPKLLLGGSWQDNLFNHPIGLEHHLDVLAACGGNYLRNTMSHRNVGNVFAYVQKDGKFDLDEFNPEYWQRFENFLRLTKDRDIIVQIEVFDPWDRFADHQSLGGWSKNPFNPDNNINYTSEESGLPTFIDYNPGSTPSDHPFYKTVPALENNELILGYQLAEVDKMLSISLNYPNVLYCLHNETGEELSFGDFFADHLHRRANEAGRKIFVTDMRYDRDIRLADFKYIYDNPQRYNFIDISQNNWQSGQVHYDRIMYVRRHILENPRPINFNKIYSGRGGEHDEAVARFFRIIFSGGASARFHRPHPLEDPSDHYNPSELGLGLSPMAQKYIRSARMLTDKLNLFTMEPRYDLISNLVNTWAYLLAESEKQYAVYFPDGGRATLDMTGEAGQWSFWWLNLKEGSWSQEESFMAGRRVNIQSPDKGHWAVVLLPDEEPVN